MKFHYAKRKHGITVMCKFSKRTIEFSCTPKVFYSFIHIYQYIQEITVKCMQWGSKKYTTAAD